MFEEIATAAAKEAQRAREAANKQAEAEKLRADIATMSAQVAKMAETLRMMSERLETIEVEANEHTAALLARLYVLAAVGLRVRTIIERAKVIEAAQQRGHLTPGEVYDRQRISQETERRAALFLTHEEFRALYRHDPQTDSKAA